MPSTCLNKTLVRIRLLAASSGNAVSRCVRTNRLIKVARLLVASDIDICPLSSAVGTPTDYCRRGHRPGAAVMPAGFGYNSRSFFEEIPS